MEKTSAIIGFINHGAFSGGRETHELLYAGLVKHPTEYHIQFWSPMYQMDKLKIDVQARAIKLIRRIKSLSFVRIL